MPDQRVTGGTWMTSKAFTGRASFMARILCLLILLNLLALDLSGAAARVRSISSDVGAGTGQYPAGPAAMCKDHPRIRKILLNLKPAIKDGPIGANPVPGNRLTKRDMVMQMLELGISLDPPADKQDAVKTPTDKNDTVNTPTNQQEAAETPANEEVPVLTQKDLSRVYKHKDEKVVYLTFDDGPTSSCTPLILDILAEENVKATFFLIGSQAKRYPGLVRRQYAEGHGIGNHSYTHAFKKIYSDTEYFMEELYRTEKLLQSILGTDKRFRLMRFPGGSYGERLAPFRERAKEGGFIYIDWNCQTGDAESSKPRTPEELIDRFMETAKGKNSLVVLMHDSPGKKTTVEALPAIIRYLKEEGYRFELLPGSRGT